mgnify:CR=1 FL=1
MLSLQVCTKTTDVVIGMFRNEVNLAGANLEFTEIPCAQNEIDAMINYAIGRNIDYAAKMFAWKYTHHIATSMYSLFYSGYNDPSYYNNNLIYVQLSEEGNNEVYEENFLLERLKYSGVKLCLQSLSVPEIQYGLVMVSRNYHCMLIKMNDVWGWVDDSFFNVISNDNEEMEQMCNDFLALVKQ